VSTTTSPPAAVSSPPTPAPYRPAPAPAPAVPTWPGWLPEVSLALLLVVSALAFGRVYRGGGWEGSALAPALAAVGVVALTRRLLRARPAAMTIDVLAVLLVVTWTVIPASTTVGLPLLHTWRSADRLLSGFGRQFEASVPPVDPTQAFLLLTALGVGAAALVAAWLRCAASRRARAAAPAPALAVFLAGCVLGGRDGRVASVIVETVVLGVYLLVEHAANSADPSLWVAGVQAPALQRPGRVGFRILVLAAVAAAIVSALPGPDGNGVIGWKTLGQGGGTRIIVSPMVSLSTRIVDNPRSDVFTVSSTVPAYWQLTTLDEYSGSTWQAGRASYESFSGRLPAAAGSRYAAKGTRTVLERFHIQSLDSPWLPSAFDPIAVRGASGVQYNPGTGSLLAERSTANGETYTVTAIETLATLDAEKLETAPALTSAHLPADSTSLPSSVPSAVRALARRIVAHAHNEYAEAIALQDYFYRPEFTYSLHPPTDGTGVDAIDTFLFDTHTGYCQQFAGSFAVMARSVGLPTRLAVGFTTGRRIGKDRYQVTDADVHTWPEVWFPRYGWVPFEPTKGAPGAGFAIPGATAVTGNTSRISSMTKRSTRTNPNRVSVPSTPATTLPPKASTSPVSPPRSSGDTLRRRQDRTPGAPSAGSSVSDGTHSSTATYPSATRTHPARSNLTWALEGLLVALAGAGVLAAADLSAVALRRRRRRRRIRAGGPGSPRSTLLHWDDLTESLATVGIRRKVWESAPCFGARAGWSLDPTGRLARELTLAGAVVDTVSWAGPTKSANTSLDQSTPLGYDTASLGDGSSDSSTVSDISEVAAEVRRRVARHRRMRDRLRLAFDVRLCWRPAPTEGDDSGLPLADETPQERERPEPVAVGGRHHGP
jgi:transglutaminase-like putative cysteine protease